MEILIIFLIMTIISIAACRWARRSMINLERTKGQRPAAKIIQMSEEMGEMLDYKLDREYQKMRSC